MAGALKLPDPIAKAPRGAATLGRKSHNFAFQAHKAYGFFWTCLDLVAIVTFKRGEMTPR